VLGGTDLQDVNLGREGGWVKRERKQTLQIARIRNSWVPSLQRDDRRLTFVPFASFGGWETTKEAL
jgi:hypothetical protein